MAKLLVDADACPKVHRETLVRASERTQVHCIFIANHAIPLPKRPTVQFLQVSHGFDVADHEIVQRAEAGDLVITSDIPLADEVIAKGALVLNNKGEMLTKDVIKAKLNIRDFMETMRASGVQTGGPSALSQTERREFANNLDRWLAKATR